MYTALLSICDALMGKPQLSGDLLMVFPLPVLGADDLGLCIRQFGKRSFQCVVELLREDPLLRIGQYGSNHRSYCFKSRSDAHVL